MRTITILCVALLTAGAFPAFSQREVIVPDGHDASALFSPAVRFGDFVYLAGVIPHLPGAGQAPASIEIQTRQTFGRLSKMLRSAGLDFSDVVSSNVFLSDARYFQAMNGVYGDFFKGMPPTRATVQADLARPSVRIEITLVVARRGLDKKAIVPEGWQKPSRPYSWGILAGDTLFISGMVSRNCETGQLLLGPIETQTRQCLENVGKVLEAAGFGFENVVSSRVYLSDARDFQGMNTTYAEFFKSEPPARATIRTSLMNPELNVEIQCVAVKDASRQVVAAPGARRSSSPFSPSIRAGDRQFLSGMVGRGPDGFVLGDVRAQARQTLQNLKATLVAAGGGFDQVLDVTVYLADVRHFALMNEVYREVFPKAPPARTTIGAQLMSPDALIEIMMTATGSQGQ